MVDFLVGFHFGEGLGFDGVVGPADVEGEVVDGGVLEVVFEEFLTDEFNDRVLGVWVRGEVPETLRVILEARGFFFLDFWWRSVSMYLPVNYYSSV